MPTAPKFPGDTMNDWPDEALLAIADDFWPRLSTTSIGFTTIPRHLLPVEFQDIMPCRFLFVADKQGGHYVYNYK